MLRIGGFDYEVHPLIKQSIEQYPGYYFAGAVGQRHHGALHLRVVLAARHHHVAEV